MKDEVPNLDEAEQGPGWLARLELRAIDAGLRGLHRLRGHIEAPVEDEADSGQHGRRKSAASDEAPAPEAAAPPRKTLLHRFLVTVMCLVIGGVAGMLISHRGFSKHIESQQKQIDYLQDEVSLSRKAEARELGAKTKLQKELTEYRHYLGEADQEINDYKAQIAELKARLAPPRSAAQAASPGRAGTPPVTARLRAPQKTGTCVTSADNPTGNVLDCVSKFNRP